MYVAKLLYKYSDKINKTPYENSIVIGPTCIQWPFDFEKLSIPPIRQAKYNLPFVIVRYSPGLEWLFSLNLYKSTKWNFLLLKFVNGIFGNNLTYVASLGTVGNFCYRPGSETVINQKQNIYLYQFCLQIWWRIRKSTHKIVSTFPVILNHIQNKGKTSNMHVCISQ